MQQMRAKGNQEDGVFLANEMIKILKDHQQRN
jgi:hypothetical protein